MCVCHVLFVFIQCGVCIYRLSRLVETRLWNANTHPGNKSAEELSAPLVNYLVVDDARAFGTKGDRLMQSIAPLTTWQIIYLQTTDNSKLHLKLILYHERSNTEWRTTLEYLTHISYLYLYFYNLQCIRLSEFIYISIQLHLITIYLIFCTIENYTLKRNNNKNNG